MDFEWQNHHFVSGRPCLDLVNTVVHADDRSRREDRLGDAAAVLGWMRAAARRTLDPATGYDGMHLFLETLRVRAASDEIFRARSEGRPVAGAAWRDLIAAHGAVLGAINPDLRVAGDGLVPDGAAPTAIGFLAALSHDAVALALSPRINRVKKCPGCHWLFLDASRNGTRRWCEMRTCGNRAKARRYSARVKRAMVSG